MRKALVLGSNGPQGLSPLRFSVRDAESVAACFAGPRCGFEVTRAPRGLEALQVRALVESIAEECVSQDTLVCYFSGHGLLERGALFLLWDNSRSDRLLGSAIPAEDVLRALRYCRAESKLLVLDCCHAGAAVSSFGVKDAVGLPVEETVSKPDNFLVLMASDRLERAREFDSLQGSFLAHNVCEALGDSFYEVIEGRDEQKLSVQELRRWLEQKAREHNRKNKDTPVPIPYLFGKSKGDFYITIGADDWISHTVQWEDGSEMIVLPLRLSSREAWCLSRYPISNKQYRDLIGKEPIGQNFVKSPGGGKWDGPFYPWRDARFAGDDKPVVCVSYQDAIAYVGRVVDLQSKRTLRSACFQFPPTGREAFPSPSSSPSFVGYRKTNLPDPAVWDFAAFGGEYPTRRPKSWMTLSKILHHKASAPLDRDVTGARANRLGLSDMVGNVWEWCLPGEQVPAVLGPMSVEPQLRGGGFLDDLSRTSVFLDASMLTDREETRHSDLGFRISGQLPLEELPEPLRIRLSVAARLESHERPLYISPAR